MISCINEDYEGKGGIINNLQINEMIRQMSSYICLIHDINGDKATGFFSKIHFPDDFTLLPVLISNSKILNKENTQIYKTIHLTLDDDKKSEFFLLIDSSRKILIDDSLGVSVIEIKDKDKINKFLDIDDNINKEDYINLYKRRPEVYTLNYSEKKNTPYSSYSGGMLKEIFDNKIRYSCKASLYSPGAPILLISNYKVIGIHIRTIKGQNDKEYSEGIFIKCVIEKFKNKFLINQNKINNFLHEGNKKTEVIIDQFFPHDKIPKKIENIIIKNKHYDSKNQIGNIFPFSHNYSNNNCNKSNYLPDRKENSIIEIFIENENENEDITIINKIDSKIYCTVINSNINEDSLNQFKEFNDPEENHQKKIKLPKGYFKVKIKIDKILTNCKEMFLKCDKIIKLDLSSLNTENVTDMSHMFEGCSKLVSIKLSNFSTEKVKNMDSMFYNCPNLSGLNLTSFKTHNVTDMSKMFASNKNLQILDLKTFNTENVIQMPDMFYECENLKQIQISSLFNNKNVINMAGMIYGCKRIENLDLSSLKIEKVESIDKMFYGCYQLKKLKLGYINAEHLKSMNYMFGLCDSIETLDLNFENTENVEEMKNMFLSCSKLLYLDLSSFKVKNIKRMNSMFSNCKNLFSVNLSSFDTRNCQHDNNTSIFQECRGLKELIIKSNIDLPFFKDELQKAKINIDRISNLENNTLLMSCSFNII